MRQHSNRENREIPTVSDSSEPERSVNVTDGTTDMYDDGKSHEFVVPATTANKGAAEAPAESDEGRNSAKRNAGQDTSHRTQCRGSGSRRLHGVREAVSRPTQGKNRMR